MTLHCRHASSLAGKDVGPQSQDAFTDSTKQKCHECKYKAVAACSQNTENTHLCAHS